MEKGPRTSYQWLLLTLLVTASLLWSVTHPVRKQSMPLKPPISIPTVKDALTREDLFGVYDAAFNESYEALAAKLKQCQSISYRGVTRRGIRCSDFDPHSRETKALVESCNTYKLCVIFYIHNHKIHYISRQLWGGRDEGILGLVSYALDTEFLNRLNNITFYVNTDDEADRDINSKLPVLTYDIPMPGGEFGYLVPDFSFWTWPELRASNMSVAEQMIYDAGKQPFQDRTDQRVLWRGRLESHHYHLRGRLAKLDSILAKDGLSNIRGITFPLEKDPNSLTLFEICQNRRYILHSEGVYGKYSSRLKWLLMCGAVVFIPKLHYGEYFNSMLQDRVTHVEISNDDPEEAARQIKHFIFSTDVEKQAQIALTGRKIGFMIASKEAGRCMWRSLVSEISTCSKTAVGWDFAVPTEAKLFVPTK